MSPRDIYKGLRDYLSSNSEHELTLTYDQIERILGRPLPGSAHGPHKRQWWANTTTHSQARSWLEAGRRARIDVANERVVFTREQRAESGANAPSDVSRVSLSDQNLTPVGRRLLEDYCEEFGVTVDQAAAAIINAAALERRKRLVEWFAANSPKTTSDSADLIRDDRDER